MINSFTRERGMRECRSGSMHDRSAVDGNRLPGDQLTGVRHEPVNGADEIRWRQGSRNRLVQLDGIERLLGLLGEEFAGPLGQHRARCDGIHADLVAAVGRARQNYVGRGWSSARKPLPYQRMSALPRPSDINLFCYRNRAFNLDAADSEQCSRSWYDREVAGLPVRR